MNYYCLSHREASLKIQNRGYTFSRCRTEIVLLRESKVSVMSSQPTSTERYELTKRSTENCAELYGGDPYDYEVQTLGSDVTLENGDKVPERMYLAVKAGTEEKHYTAAESSTPKSFAEFLKTQEAHLQELLDTTNQLVASA